MSHSFRNNLEGEERPPGIRTRPGAALWGCSSSTPPSQFSQYNTTTSSTSHFPHKSIVSSFVNIVNPQNRNRKIVCSSAKCQQSQLSRASPPPRSAKSSLRTNPQISTRTQLLRISLSSMFEMMASPLSPAISPLPIQLRARDVWQPFARVATAQL
jgi:hypothetical protein